MLLLTGATGLVGTTLLPRLLDDGMAVRCLVRDPRRLGAQRVRVQIALGDLADPRSFRNAMRGVDTVVHLATATRDQPGGSIEELVTMSTWRMLTAARRAGVQRFVFFSALGACAHSRARLFKAKAVAERAVAEAGSAQMRCTVIAPSLVYAPEDRWLRLVQQLARLPAIPVPGSARGVCQPIWAQDLAGCVVALLGSGNTPRAASSTPAQDRYELAGPETLTYDEAIRTVLHSAGRERPLLHVPAPLARRAIGAIGRIAGEDTPLTWDEAELLRTDSVSARGAADARVLGVDPQRMSLVLGLG
jgi:uncharacterized protein YbjT (DUF2867 family)